MPCNKPTYGLVLQTDGETLFLVLFMKTSSNSKMFLVTPSIVNFILAC